MSTPATATANIHHGLIREPCQEDLIDQRRQLIKSIRGTTVIIPDLHLPMSHWPSGVNGRIQELDDDVQCQLESIFASVKDANRLRKMKHSGVALFGASWWAMAPFATLRIATYLSLWLFAWDDETDSFEFSNMIHHFDQASAFRRETMAYIEASLTPERHDELCNISTNPIITNFKPVGEAIASSCTSPQVETFLKEIRFFIQMTEEEQRLQMTRRLPSIDEYSRRRMGSSAVRVCLAITEYAYNITLPEEVMSSDAMQAIWHETNIIISTTNDLLSIKKEMALEQVDTLIPLLAMELGSVQRAIDRASEEVEKSIHRFDEAADTLMAFYGSDEYVKRGLVKFIDGCKYACTANLNWSLASGRYQIGTASMTGGLKVTL